MSRRQHRVVLTPEQRQELRTLAKSTASTALAFQHARILLMADEAQPGRRQSDQAVGAAVGVSGRTVTRVREQFATQGLDACLERRQTRRIYPTRLDDAQQAQLTKLACSTPPAGRASWTLKLLAEQLVVLEITPGICAETVRTTLKKTGSSPGSARAG
ncbi:MAG: helix-turn-helix domain-containing protein [Thermomicrobiales bacterium]|nr:helix-turn-helix domain-containing protein [Thermomicrobiales bacterium]